MSETQAPPLPDAAPAPAAHPKVGPPISFLLSGVISVVASLVLVLRADLTAHVLGYVLASILPFLLVGLFRHSDFERRISPYYVGRPIINRLIPVVLVLGMLAAIVHTWSIATELAK